MIHDCSRYELQRLASTGSSTAEADSGVVYLGDDKPFVFGEKVLDHFLKSSG